MIFGHGASPFSKENGSEHFWSSFHTSHENGRIQTHDLSLRLQECILPRPHETWWDSFGHFFRNLLKSRQSNENELTLHHKLAIIDMLSHRGCHNGLLGRRFETSGIYFSFDFSSHGSIASVLLASQELASPVFWILRPMENVQDCLNAISHSNITTFLQLVSPLHRLSAYLLTLTTINFMKRETKHWIMEEKCVNATLSAPD